MSAPVKLPKGFLQPQEYMTLLPQQPQPQPAPKAAKAKAPKPTAEPIPWTHQNAAVTGIEAVPTKAYTLTLPPELGVKLLAPTKGQGGWQTIMGALKAGLAVQQHEDGSVTYQLTLKPALIASLIPYAVKYGGGGYQGTIRHVLVLLLQAYQTDLLQQVEGK